MKWREPWKFSLGQQQPFNPFSRSVLKDAVLWSAVLLAMMLLSTLGQDGAVQLERAFRLWLAPVLGGSLALLIYAVRWLSPRMVASGPSGLVISKGDQLVLIPWRAIDHYAFQRMAGANALVLVDTLGHTHMLALAQSIHPDDVERELVRVAGKHRSPSLKPTPSARLN
jgi:hypothetical protein